MKCELEVNKMCSATITIEADSPESAKEKAEFLKYHMQLIWK
jgi:hypothetical protein